MNKLYTEEEVMYYMTMAAEAAVTGYRKGLQTSLLVNSAATLILARIIIFVTKKKKRK